MITGLYTDADPITKPDGVTVDTDKTAVLYFLITIGMLILSSLFYVILIFTPEYQKKKSGTERVYKPLKQQIIGYYLMFKKKWIDGITIYLTLTATLFIFPVLLLKVESTSNNKDWSIAFIISLLRKPIPNTMWMIILALSRFLFLFIFFLCPRGVNSIFPAIYNHDILPILFVFIFGLTNGHLITIVFSVPYSLDTREQQIDCSTLFVLLLGCGLASGSLLSWVL
ncbi:hypothetical protein MXB_2212 [Myxobolus squamalis]|nr:hypothetical protein MXB_2212 [Myxobolus squamalis]